MAGFGPGGDAEAGPGMNGVGLVAVIADLQRRLRQLSAYIDDNRDELSHGGYLAAVRLQGMLSNRIARLLLDRKRLTGDQADELSAAIDEALDLVGDVWGVDL